MILFVYQAIVMIAASSVPAWHKNATALYCNRFVAEAVFDQMCEIMAQLANSKKGQLVA